MQRIVLILMGLFVYVSALAQSDNEGILGKWTNEDKSRTIEIVQNGDSFEAIITEAEDSSLVGQKQITGLIADGGSSYSNGKLHLIKQGRTANCTLTLVDESKLTIKASLGRFSRTQTWTKL